MPKPSLSISVTAETRCELNVSANARQMLQARLNERAEISTQVKDKEKRKKRIDKELDDILTAEGQGGVLLDGVEIDGHKLKTVCGSTSKLNLDKLKRKFGLTQADIDSCVDEKENEPYLKVTPPGAKETA